MTFTDFLLAHIVIALWFLIASQLFNSGHENLGVIVLMIFGYVFYFVTKTRLDQVKRENLAHAEVLKRQAEVDAFKLSHP